MERGRETELRPCPASKDVKDELLAHTYIDSAVYVEHLCVMLGIKPRASCMLGRLRTTELQLRPPPRTPVHSIGCILVLSMLSEKWRFFKAV